MDNPIIYTGERIFPDGGKDVRGSCMVMVDNHILPSIFEPTPFDVDADVNSRNGYYYGENEFEWACCGTSTSSNLAKSILADFMAMSDIPEYVWIPFRKDFVEHLAFERWVLSENQIREWLTQFEKTL